jgi:hypothetical protein
MADYQYSTYSYGQNGEQDDINVSHKTDRSQQLRNVAKDQEVQIRELRKTVKDLTKDLAMAKHAISSQENRLRYLEKSRFSSDATTGPSSAEAKHVDEVAQLGQVVYGIQRIADVAAEVSNMLTCGNYGNVGANSVVTDTTEGQQAGTHSGYVGIRVSSPAQSTAHTDTTSTSTNEDSEDGATMPDMDEAQNESGYDRHMQDVVGGNDCVDKSTKMEI